MFKLFQLSITPLVFFVLSAQACNGQNNYPSKKSIQKIFRSSIKQVSKRKVQVGNNAWTTCNKDSTFFKSDTIVFTNSTLEKCCATIQWTFYRKQSFVQNAGQTCSEPSSATVTNVDDFYTIDLVEDGKYVFMEISNKARNIIRFRVISVNNESRSIKLLRI